MKFIIALLLSATSAGATCMPSVVLLEKLSKAGEHIESMATDHKGRQITIWANRSTGSWSAVMSIGGTSCFMAYGMEYKAGEGA